MTPHYHDGDHHACTAVHRPRPLPDAYEVQLSPRADPDPPAPNAETRTVALWLENSEGWYYAARWAAESMDAAQAESSIRGLVNLMVGERSGLAGDLVGDAIQRVDWAAILGRFADEEPITRQQRHMAAAAILAASE